MQKRNCAECNAEFSVLKYDAHSHLAKVIYCPDCRCQPGRHKYTLIKYAVVCTDCGKRRVPLHSLVCYAIARKHAEARAV